MSQCLVYFINYNSHNFLTQTTLISHPGSQVGMAGSRLRWWDPTFPTWDENLIPPGIPHLMRDSCIPPGILGGTYAFYPGSWSGFTYPTWDSLSHPRKYCFAVFILTKHFCESSNTYGSSTHSANIWHADKTEVVTVPFEKIHLLNDFFNFLYLKLWSENILKKDLLVVRGTNWVSFHNLIS